MFGMCSDQSFYVKHPEYSLADLLSLHPIDQRIECRWHQEVECGQKNMDVMDKAAGLGHGAVAEIT